MIRALPMAVCAALLLSACTLPSRRTDAPRAPDSRPPQPPADVLAIPDAVPRAEPRSARGNPAFYKVAGKRYVLLASAEDYRASGVASWYGADFHGKSTSSGEPYDMYAMTAAHKTLPIPCYARITNPANGRSVVVRINDRGPFVDNRLIDLSYSAAAKLDLIRNGTGFVDIAVLSATPPDAAPQPAFASTGQPAPTHWYVQVGAYGEAANAERVNAALRSAGLNAVIAASAVDERPLLRVRVGPVHSVADYDALIAQLERLGLRDTVLISAAAP